MELIFIYSALLIGFFSGFHCIGMCGPIALSLGIDSKNKIKFYFQNLLYQFGRISTYACLGAIVGVFRQSLNILIYQNYISIVAGVLLILMVVLPGKITEFGQNFRSVNKFMVKIKIKLGKFIQRKNSSSRYITGVLNGLLPCGAVYAALTSSLSVNGIAQGAIYMFFFGLGTLPIMFSVVILGKFISVEWRNRMSKIFPIIILILGIILILRGMNLGIDYISPSHGALQINGTEECH